ncbi:steroid C27-monooxygenase, partial [Streptomyces albidoflavus]
MALSYGIDVTDASLYEDGVPHGLFARLRSESPVWWNAQPSGVGGFPDEGFWVVSTNELVREVSRDGKTFSSWENTVMPRYADHCPREHIDSGRTIMLNMDAPEHTQLRAII